MKNWKYILRPIQYLGESRIREGGQIVLDFKPIQDRGGGTVQKVPHLLPVFPLLFLQM